MTYVDFDSGITFPTEIPTKNRQINRERNYNIRSCEKLKCIPSNDRHNCSFDEQQTSNISLNPYNLWDMVPAALCHSTTLMIQTLCRISTLNQQLTNLKQTHIRYSPDYERWRAKRRDCASALHYFKGKTYRMDEWTKQLLRSKWSTIILFKCNYVFQLFLLYCLLVQCLLFFIEGLIFSLF